MLSHVRLMARSARLTSGHSSGILILRRATYGYLRATVEPRPAVGIERGQHALRAGECGPQGPGGYRSPPPGVGDTLRHRGGHRALFPRLPAVHRTGGDPGGRRGPWGDATPPRRSGGLALVLLP